MDIYESLSMLGIQSRQELQRYELKELNNTLKQIAEAQGIKLKSIAEIAAEEEKRELDRRRKIEQIEEERERIIIEAEAKERGLSVEEYLNEKTKDSLSKGLLSVIKVFVFSYLAIAVLVTIYNFLCN